MRMQFHEPLVHLVDAGLLHGVLIERRGVVAYDLQFGSHVEALLFEGAEYVGVVGGAVAGGVVVVGARVVGDAAAGIDLHGAVEVDERRVGVAEIHLHIAGEYVVVHHSGSRVHEPAGVGDHRGGVALLIVELHHHLGQAHARAFRCPQRVVEQSGLGKRAVRAFGGQRFGQPECQFGTVGLGVVKPAPHVYGAVVASDLRRYGGKEHTSVEVVGIGVRIIGHELVALSHFGAVASGEPHAHVAQLHAYVFVRGVKLVGAFEQLVVGVGMPGLVLSLPFEKDVVGLARVGLGIAVMALPGAYGGDAYGYGGQQGGHAHCRGGVHHSSPVCPNPPSPRRVASSCSAGSHSTCE